MPRYNTMVWCNINLDDAVPQLRVPVLTAVDGALLINALTQEQVGRADIDSNAFGLLVWDDERSEWAEWEGDLHALCELLATVMGPAVLPGPA